MSLFDTNRRGFLIGLTGALVAVNTAATLIIPDKALADPMIGKYAMAVKLQRDLIASGTNMKVAAHQYEMEHGIFMHGLKNHPSPLVADMFRQFQAEADSLFGFLIATFPAVDSDDARRQVRELFAGSREINAMSEGDLMSLLDSVVPVAVALNLLKHNRLPIHTTAPNFNRFADAFKGLILQNV